MHIYLHFHLIFLLGELDVTRWTIHAAVRNRHGQLTSNLIESINFTILPVRGEYGTAQIQLMTSFITEKRMRTYHLVTSQLQNGHIYIPATRNLLTQLEADAANLKVEVVSLEPGVHTFNVSNISDLRSANVDRVTIRTSGGIMNASCNCHPLGEAVHVAISAARGNIPCASIIAVCTMQGLNFKNMIDHNRLLETYEAAYLKQEKTVAKSELLADIRVGDCPGDIKKKRGGKRKIAGRKRPSRSEKDNKRRKTEVGQGFPGVKDVSDAAHVAAVGATSFPKTRLFALDNLRLELTADDVVTLQKPGQPISSFALDTAARVIMSSIDPMPTEKGLLFAVLRPHSVQKLAQVGLSVQDMGQIGVWVVTRAVSSASTPSSSSHSLTHEYVWSLSTLASTVTSFDVLDKLIILFLMNVSNDSHWLLGSLKERILHIFDSFPTLTESNYKVPYPVKTVMKNFFVATGLALSTTFVPYETILVTSPHQATTAACEGDTETCGMFMISNFRYVLEHSSLIGDPINMSYWSYVPRKWLLEKFDLNQDDFSVSTAASAAIEHDIDFELQNGEISVHEYLQVCKVLAQSKPDSITFSEKTKESSLRQLLSYKAVLKSEAASVQTQQQIFRAALGNFEYEVVISDSVKLSRDDMDDLRAGTHKMFSDQHINAIIAIANNVPVTPVGGCQSLLFAHEPNPFLENLHCVLPDVVRGEVTFQAHRPAINGNVVHFTGSGSREKIIYYFDSLNREKLAPGELAQLSRLYTTALFPIAHITQLRMEPQEGSECGARIAAAFVQLTHGQTFEQVARFAPASIPEQYKHALEQIVAAGERVKNGEPAQLFALFPAKKNESEIGLHKRESRSWILKQFDVLFSDGEQELKRVAAAQASDNASHEMHKKVAIAAKAKADAVPPKCAIPSTSTRVMRPRAETLTSQEKRAIQLIADSDGKPSPTAATTSSVIDLSGSESGRLSEEDWCAFVGAATITKDAAIYKSTAPALAATTLTAFGLDRTLIERWLAASAIPSGASFNPSTAGPESAAKTATPSTDGEQSSDADTPAAAEENDDDAEEEAQEKKLLACLKLFNPMGARQPLPEKRPAGGPAKAKKAKKAEM